MVDLQTVCCMCGDVGFPDKLFRCNKCRNRFQHSYCSNYYSEYAEPIELCDWCQSEGKSTRHGSSSKRSSGAGSDSVSNRSEYAGDKIKQPDREDGGDKGKNPGGAPSPRPTTRRYFPRPRTFLSFKTIIKACHMVYLGF
ncbi:protein PARALOG OF AIPP2 isoform X1 [Ziziphus jujuba]|uniref:Protein PARALOG OF AIPP2 isoform X1 n=1 Tax=Ziziphus jujuba TaxID=326968 RepID=A0ABM3IU29_ZIZJJ|nr:protein PARALOG OF AIPP2 isoform X1 [Ziziphus jujuba]